MIAGALSDRPGFAGVGGVSAWGMVTADALVSGPSTVVLDDYVRQQDVGRVDVIKIDIEGSEQKALIGAASLLGRDHPDIVIEINSATCGAFGMSYRDLFRLLLGHGYHLYRILPYSLAPWKLTTWFRKRSHLTISPRQRTKLPLSRAAVGPSVQ